MPRYFASRDEIIPTPVGMMTSWLAAALVNRQQPRGT
jgi:hypothetical protein